jgi:putative FmdB family regulatory protein
MPLYEYECERCSHRFEVIQRFSDPLVKKCPKCGSPVRKLFSSPAIQFKGSGFYITDYPKNESGAPKSSGGAQDKESPAAAESTSDKGSETKGDKTKGDTKGETKGETTKGGKTSTADTPASPSSAATKKEPPAPTKKD